MQGNNFNIVYLLLFSLLLTNCNRDRNNPGWDYFPDMAYSTAYESYSPNPNFTDGMTMRVPPEGTIPRGFEPFEYTIDPQSRIKAGKELINPVMISETTLQRGKEVFTTFCIDCHGAGGEGDGHLYTSGLYPVKPRSLVSAEAKALKDGEIYHTITLGFGAMGAHGSQVRPEDRWKVILYIRKLQEEAVNLSDKNEGGNK
jgi:mono/diheme cytochrome c family protein